jgi:hypothetical protein
VDDPAHPFADDVVVLRHDPNLAEQLRLDRLDLFAAVV